MSNYNFAKCGYKTTDLLEKLSIHSVECGGSAIFNTNVFIF